MTSLVSLPGYIKEMEALEYSPVLIFKQQGDQANELCSNLKNEKH